MKLQWLKDIVGDTYTEDMDAKVCAALGGRFVAKGDFDTKNAKVTELEAQIEQLNSSIKERDGQLSELKKSAGASEDLQKQIDALTEQNKAQAQAHAKELERMRLMSAVDAELTAAGAKNLTAAKAVLGDFLDKAKIVDGKVSMTANGESTTLSGKIEALKKDASTDFLFGSPGGLQGLLPGDPGGNPPKPDSGKKDLSKMSYGELTEFLASNPGTRLE